MIFEKSKILTLNLVLEVCSVRFEHFDLTVMRFSSDQTECEEFYTFWTKNLQKSCFYIFPQFLGKNWMLIFTQKTIKTNLQHQPKLTRKTGQFRLVLQAGFHVFHETW